MVKILKNLILQIIKFYIFIYSNKYIKTFS